MLSLGRNDGALLFGSYCEGVCLGGKCCQLEGSTAVMLLLFTSVIQGWIDIVSRVRRADFSCRVGEQVIVFLTIESNCFDVQKRFLLERWLDIPLFV